MTKRIVDWEAIEREYRAGVLSVSEIARQHGIAHPTIFKKAKAFGWERKATGATAKAATAKTTPKPVAPTVAVIINDDLSSKQSLFVYEYMVDGNATRAAIAAGYAEKSAAVTGSQLIRNAKVSAEIARRRKEVLNPLAVTFERVVKELARLSFVDPAEFYNENGDLKLIHEMPEDVRRALCGMETELRGVGDENALPVIVKKLKWHDKRTALDSLAKLSGFVVDKKEVSGPGGGAIPIEVVNAPEKPKTIAEWEKQIREAEEGRKLLESVINE